MLTQFESVDTILNCGKTSFIHVTRRNNVKFSSKIKRGIHTILIKRQKLCYPVKLCQLVTQSRFVDTIQLCRHNLNYDKMVSKLC